MKRQATAMINRNNYQDTRVYLKYRAEIRRNEPDTCTFARVALDHLLRWATSTPLAQAAELRPTFPSYIEALGGAPSYLQKILANVRDFFEYAADAWPTRYHYKRDYLDSLRIKQREQQPTMVTIYSLEQIHILTRVNPRLLREEADIAAVAFIFLSGMRAGAFVSLPVGAVDVTQTPITVNQWPALGVRTKNGKAATTYLLQHPDLEDLRALVVNWDAKVRAAIPDGLWYPVLDPASGRFAQVQTAGKNRDDAFRRRLELLCDRAGIEYLSPHQLRHAHISWARDHCQSIADFKAVSQNVMHSSMDLTDRVYSTLTPDALAARMLNLGRSAKGGDAT